MIYVLSDIHGQSRRFHSILSQIDLNDEDTLYILGDVIDRNPDGISAENGYSGRLACLRLDDMKEFCSVD